MRRMFSISFALIGIIFAQISLACDKPSDIDIPNGKKATEAEMIEADQALQQFMVQMQQYQDCLSAETDA